MQRRALLNPIGAGSVVGATTAGVLAGASAAVDSLRVRCAQLQPLTVHLILKLTLMLLASVVSQAFADDGNLTDRVVTWEVSHPELREIFGHPFSSEGQTHRAMTFVSWPSTLHESELPAIQPTVAIGTDDELFAHSCSPKGWDLGMVAHSTDGGLTWSHIGSPVDMRFKVPAGNTQLRAAGNGIGITHDGSLLYYFSVQHNDGRLLAADEDDPSHRVEAYVARSADGGKTWDPAVKINSSEREQTGAQSCRFTQLPGRRIALVLGSWNVSTASGEPIPITDQYTRTWLYTSDDDGKTWKRGEKPICAHGVEPDLVALPSGRLLLAIRYQRHKFSSDPPDLASPHLLRDDKPPFTKSKQLHSGFVARFTAILHSDDGGTTWTEPRLLTGFDEQTASLVRLSDGTIILPFGYKTDTRGQRFLVSYDEGETWSRTVFQLHPDGQYASSVVLSDDTIVSVIHGTEGLNLQSLRWQAPSREHVIAGGFWRPRVVEPLGRAVSRQEPLDGWQLGQQHRLDGGLRVSLSQPVLVTRSTGYRWFPSLTRLADGALLATMSNYPDEHVSTATAEAAWSRDGGLTWSETKTTRYGDVSMTLPNGDELLLPYYLKPIGDSEIGAPYQICRLGEQQLHLIQPGVRLSGLPAEDRSFSPEHGLSGFVFNGQSVTLKDGNYLAMLYGYFQGSKRYSLLAAQSPDGVSWRIRAMVAGEDCPLSGNNGPCESAVCRLRDGRLMCVFRLASNVAYGQTFSSDDGKTWSDPIAVPEIRSVQPSLAVMSDGVVALSGGRPGLYLWLNSDGTGRDWQVVDVVANHNEFRPEESVVVSQRTSAYTEIVALDDKHLLYIYDRIPNGWMQIPGNSSETNSVWVVRVTVDRTSGN